MKRRGAAFAAAIIFLSVAVPGCRWFAGEPPLTVHLRCAENTSGRLSAAVILPNGAADAEKSFELADACQIGTIEIVAYRQEAAVRFTLERENGETQQIFAEYGQDIQSDQNGFYTVLKFTEKPPFIIKDSI